MPQQASPASTLKFHRYTEKARGFARSSEHSRQLTGRMNRVVTTILLSISAMLRVSHSDVYKSSQKIEDMVLKEEQILNRLYTAISETRNDTVLDYFSQFYNHRLHRIKIMDTESLRMYLQHPNGIYSLIKSFSSEYQGLREIIDSSSSSDVQNCLYFIADHRDLAAARMSLIRLQDVYNLTVSDMIRGDYLRFAGPQLTEEDAWEIGQAAFRDGKLSSSIKWLQAGVDIAGQQQQPSVGFLGSDETQAHIGRMLALIGRAYIRLGDNQKAEEKYRQALVSAPPGDSNVSELEKELMSKPHVFQEYRGDLNLRRLCLLQNKLTQEKFDLRLKCSYRPARPPYYRFKQELVSVSPYVVLFYDVVTQTEIDYILKLTTARMSTGKVMTGNGSAVKNEDIRTSDLSFIYDLESPLVADMSRRVAAATGLLTLHSSRSGLSLTAEPFQVVNYGMGGHYDLHFDTFNNNDLLNYEDKRFYDFGGNRLATFLIYLSDTGLGGSTVFPLLDLAVKPVKKMALFWYSYKPSAQIDKRTLHAACPVVIGHKWVTNKWMWLYGNTFTRRCGLRKSTNQLAIEKFMRTGWV